MTGDFGLSFAPTGQNEAQNAQNQTPLQDAIKVLSLRIPSFVGAQGIAPQALLGGAGAAGAPGASAVPGGPGPGGVPGGLDDWLRRLLMGMGNPMGGGQPGGQPAAMGAPPPMGIPTPRVTPGDEARYAPANDAPTPLIGGITNPGTFAPNASAGRPSPMIQGGQPPMRRLA